MVLNQENNQNFMNIGDRAEVESAIQAERENMNELYAELGKLYMSIHSSDYEQALAEAVEAIKAAETNIQKYTQQLEELNDFIKCPTCGTELPKIAAFCINCGTQMAMPVEPQPEEDQSTVKCPACGQAVEDDMKFCTFCGYALSGQSVPVDVAEEVAPVEEPIAQEPALSALELEPPVVPAMVCAACGQSVEADMKFCTFCGAVINKEPEQPKSAAMEDFSYEPAALVSAPVAPVIEAPAEESVAPEVNTFVCSACGQSIEAGTKFCTYCGTPVAAPAPAVSVEPKCHNCGATVPRGSAFCVECGTKL